jgi:hypothetical protein
MNNSKFGLAMPKNKTQIRLANIYELITQEGSTSVLGTPIGKGLTSVAYLLDFHNKYLILKRSKLPDSTVTAWKPELLSEIGLYNYIDTMSTFNQQFFTKCYDWRIFDNCYHYQLYYSTMTDDSQRLEDFLFEVLIRYMYYPYHLYLS